MIVVGLGARSGVALPGPVLAALASVGLAVAEVGMLATVDRRAGEERVRALAAAYGWKLAGYPAGALAVTPVPNPGHAATVVGTPSVAEAAALLAAGPGATLILQKQARDGVTVAIAVSPDR